MSFHIYLDWFVAPYLVRGCVVSGSSIVQSGVWRLWDVYLDLHANLGERHVPLRCPAISDSSSSDATRELSVLGPFLAAVSGSDSLVGISDGSRVLADI